MTRADVIEKVAEISDIPKAKVSKVLSKMKKEKTVFYLDNYNHFGEKLISME